MYKGEADWSLISEVKNNPRMKIPVFGNGDINSPEKALRYKNTYGVDGIMIGRASIGNPWFFNQIKHFLKTGNNSAMPSLEERVKVVKEHLDFSIRWKGDRVGIVEMRRHYANYFKGIPNFKPIRTQLVTLESKDELLEVLNGIVNQFELELI
jgi:tRNA-dihydrouridine synthase